MKHAAKRTVEVAVDIAATFAIHVVGALLVAAIELITPEPEDTPWDDQ